MKTGKALATCFICSASETGDRRGGSSLGFASLASAAEARGIGTRHRHVKTARTSASIDFAKMKEDMAAYSMFVRLLYQANSNTSRKCEYRRGR